MRSLEAPSIFARKRIRRGGFTKYSAKYDEALINSENERLKYLEQLSENARLQVKLADAEFHAYMHEKCARTALELARENKKEANIID